MATYAIGDIQGCFDPLKALLEKIKFDPNQDQLWFAGDLVNRGPKSLETLRFIKSIPNVITVLGNHDFHLLALSCGLFPDYKDHSLNDILSAPDLNELIDWLRHRPMMHHDVNLGYTLVHAGFAPQWTIQQAKVYAQEVENILQSDNYHDLLENMYADEPNQWSENLTGWNRLRFIINAFTRVRFCNANGGLDLSSKGTVDAKEDHQIPWFDIPDRASKQEHIIFGHWAALQGQTHSPNVHAVDGGCVWGNNLIAMRLEDQQRFRVACS